VVIEGGWIGDVVVVETVIGVDTEGLNVVVETTDVAHVGIVLLTLTFEGTVITVIVSGTFGVVSVGMVLVITGSDVCFTVL